MKIKFIILLMGVLIYSSHPYCIMAQESEAIKLTESEINENFKSISRAGSSYNTSLILSGASIVFSIVALQSTENKSAQVSFSVLALGSSIGSLISIITGNNRLRNITYNNKQQWVDGESGIGIRIVEEDKFVRIVSIIQDTPAYRNGILAGDLIVKINGESVRGLSISEFLNQLRGPKGTEVILTIWREEEDRYIEFNLERSVY